MIYLDRIYTKSGDEGQTSLWDGTRVSKTNPRVVAYGSVDELNSVIGLVLADGHVGLSETAAEALRHIQNDLFDLGADLCVPQSVKPASGEPLRVIAPQVERLERYIDDVTAQLEPLKTFVLPGGTPASARLHLARTVCRRVEIEVLRLAEFDWVNPQAAIYLNRLSDLLFVLARQANSAAGDVLWVPGKFRESN